MKLQLTKYELLALTHHLVGQPSPNPEHGRKRLRAWDELGVSDLADQLASAFAGFGPAPQTADWSNKTTQHEVELSQDIVDYITAGLAAQIAGIWADTLTRLRDRLRS